MTCIAWDGQILAADRMSVAGDVKSEVSKLRITADGMHALAFAGSLSDGLVLCDWFEAGADPKQWPAFQTDANFTHLIVLTRATWHLTRYDSLPRAVPVEASMCQAWGSGYALAVGAMEAGVNAWQAIEIAARRCPTVGFGCDYVMPEPQIDFLRVRRV